MAEAMQGVMSLAPEMGGMGGASKSYLTPEDEMTLTQLRGGTTPQQFTSEMFNTVEQADPQLMARVRSVLRGVKLPPEFIEALKQLIDFLLGDPANYVKNRKELIAKGIPEKIFPAEFNAQYLIAFGMVLEQLSTQTPVQGFAKGGLVKKPLIHQMAKGIASLGRRGDTILAHINPQEAAVLKAMGGSGTINPATGLPEFNFFSDFFSDPLGTTVDVIKGGADIVVDGVKAVGDVVTDFVKSPVGQVVTSVALAYFLGPQAASMLGVNSVAGVAAISGFVGGAGSTLLAGGSIGDALKAGAVSGLAAGAFSGVTGGAGAFESGSYAGPKTVGGMWKQFTESLGGTAPAGAAKDVTTGLDATKTIGSKAGELVDETAAINKAGLSPNQVAAMADEAAGIPVAGVPPPQPDLQALKADIIGGRTGAVPTPAIEAIPIGPTNLSSYTGPGGITPPNISGVGPGSSAYAGPTAPVNLSGTGPVTSAYTGPTAPINLSGTGPGSSAYTGPTTPVNLSGTGPVSTTPTRIADFSTPQEALAGIPSVQGGQLDPITLNLRQPASAVSPITEPEGVMSLLGKGEYLEAGKAAGTKLGNLYDEYLSPSGIQERGQQRALDAYKKTLAETSDEVLARKAYEEALPKMFETYGPLAAAGMGAAYLGGAFTPEPPPKPNIPESGASLYARNPYTLNPRVQTYYASTGERANFATGGVASLARGGQTFPRKTGPIDGPGTGTSDSIPAMLSDGEFVFTAKAVRAMGGGSRRKGAKRMYALMKALEKRA